MKGEPHIIEKCNDEEYFCHFVHYANSAAEGHVHKDLDNYFYRFQSESSISVVYNIFGTALFLIWRRLTRQKICGIKLRDASDAGKADEFLTSILGPPKIIELKDSDVLVFRSTRYHVVKPTSDGRYIFQFNAGFTMVK
jgi:hypothetical protein